MDFKKIIIILLLIFLVGVFIFMNINKKEFLFIVEDTFNIAEIATVTGRVDRGSVKIGDKVKVIVGDKELITEVIRIQTFDEEKKSAVKGENVGIGLKDVSIEEIETAKYLKNSK